MNNVCDICGSEARFHVSSTKGMDAASYCLGCHNRIIALQYNTELPEDVPDRLWAVDDQGNERNFDVELILHGHINQLVANERGAGKYRCVVLGDPKDPFCLLWNELVRRIAKSINTKYLDENRCPIKDSLVGYIEYNHDTENCDLVVDGQSLDLTELQRIISGREGFLIRISFADESEDIE